MVTNEQLHLKFEQQIKDNHWDTGLICPHCGLINQVIDHNCGEPKTCLLCGYQGTFLYKKLWLTSEPF